MRTQEQVAEGYKVFRGRCKELCEAAVAADPALTLVRGHIFVAQWPSDPEQPHWWCKRGDGTIHDPSWQQFPFNSPPSVNLYFEFDGNIDCANCGETFKETDPGVGFDGRHAFCSHKCHGQFVGLY